MRLPLAIVTALVTTLFLARVANTAGVSLSWDACSAEGGVQSKTFACNSNSGSHSALASFSLDAAESTFVGVEAIVDVQADADSLPNWWKFYNAGSCRSAALSVSFDFSSTPDTSCTDAFQGLGNGGIGSFQTYWTTPPVPGGAANTARLTLVGAVPAPTPIVLDASTEYYAFKLTISNTKTVGTGACGGCSVPTCLTLYSIRAVQQSGPSVTLTTVLTDNVAHWQSSNGSCPGAQIPPPPTWGQMKSILR